MANSLSRLKRIISILEKFFTIPLSILFTYLLLLLKTIIFLLKIEFNLLNGIY